MARLNDCVLIVDRDALDARRLWSRLDNMEVHVCGITFTADHAVRMALLHRPKAVIMDLDLYGPENGVDTALAIHDRVGSQVIFLSRSREPATLDRIADGRPAEILFRPARAARLRAAVQAALQPPRLAPARRTSGLRGGAATAFAKPARRRRKAVSTRSPVV
jgi:DNA-binding NarL/FixJ family response regulator